MFFFTDMVVFPERLLRLYPKIASLKLVGGPWFMELSSKTGRLRIGSYSTMRSTTLMFMGKRIAPRRYQHLSIHQCIAVNIGIGRFKMPPRYGCYYFKVASSAMDTTGER